MNGPGLRGAIRTFESMLLGFLTLMLTQAMGVSGVYVSSFALVYMAGCGVGEALWDWTQRP